MRGLSLSLFCALLPAAVLGCGDDKDDDSAETAGAGGDSGGDSTTADPFVLDGSSAWEGVSYEIQDNSCGFDVEGTDTTSTAQLYITVEPSVGDEEGAFRLAFGAESGTFDCVLAAGGGFSCAPLSSIQDLTNGTGDARFRTDQALSGTFRSAQRLSGTYEMDLSCAGSDCATYAQYFPYDLPCAYAFTFTADRR